MSSPVPSRVQACGFLARLGLAAALPFLPARVALAAPDSHAPVIAVQAPAPNGADAKTWPCQQPFVPKLSPELFWESPPAPDPNWQNDAALAKLVAEISSRDLPVSDATAKLQSYFSALPAPERRQKLPALFTGLFQTIAAERNAVMLRLLALGKRQLGLAETVRKLESEEGDEAALQREFALRALQSEGQTLRYVCQIPQELEARLGAFVRILQAGQ